MADHGFNFRGTVGYISPDSDGANTVDVLGSSADGYQQVVGPHSFGWTSGSSATGSDRSTSPDVRLRGQNNFSNNTTASYFQVDLDSTGDHTIFGAFGDATASREDLYFELQDTSTTFKTMDDGGAITSAGNFWDANGTKHTSAANWVSSNVGVARTFTTTIFRCRVVHPTETGTYGVIAHLYVQDDTGGGGVTLTIGGSAAASAQVLPLVTRQVTVAGSSSAAGQSIVQTTRRIAVAASAQTPAQSLALVTRALTVSGAATASGAAILTPTRQLTVGASASASGAALVQTTAIVSITVGALSTTPAAAGAIVTSRVVVQGSASTPASAAVQATRQISVAASTEATGQALVQAFSALAIGASADGLASLAISVLPSTITITLGGQSAAVAAVLTQVDRAIAAAASAASTGQVVLQVGDLFRDAEVIRIPSSGRKQIRVPSSGPKQIRVPG